MWCDQGPKQGKAWGCVSSNTSDVPLINEKFKILKFPATEKDKKEHSFVLTSDLTGLNFQCDMSEANKGRACAVNKNKGGWEEMKIVPLT